MTREKQIQESKQLIADALLELLDKRPMPQITLSEIASRAGVARMTLYRHFKDKDDIVVYIIETKLKEHLAHMGGPENLSLRDVLRFRFEFLANSPHTRMALESNLLSRVLPVVRSSLVHKLSLPQSTDRDTFRWHFAVGGIDGATEAWIRGGMLTAPTEMADRVYAALQTIGKSPLLDG